jgi:hypothetical protein
LALDDWIDDLCDLWDFTDKNGDTVLAYLCHATIEGERRFPSALSKFPCALTFVDSARIQYSTGGPLIDLYYGHTEFHVVGNADLYHYPLALTYIEKIRNAAAAAIELNDKVDHFTLRNNPDCIVGPTRLTFGDETPHLGLVAYWEVKENSSGSYTVRA